MGTYNPVVLKCVFSQGALKWMKEVVVNLFFLHAIQERNTDTLGLHSLNTLSSISRDVTQCVNGEPRVHRTYLKTRIYFIPLICTNGDHPPAPWRGKVSCLVSQQLGFRAGSLSSSLSYCLFYVIGSPNRGRKNPKI